MQRSVIISSVFHAAVIAYAYFGLPDLFASRQPMMNAPIPIEVMTIGEVSKAPPKKEEPKPEPPKPEAKPEPPKPEPPKPEPPKQAAPTPPPPPPPQVAALPPEPPKPDPKPAAKPAPEPIPIPEVKPAPKPQPKPVEEAKPAPPPVIDAPKPKPKPKQPEFDPNRLAALLDKKKQQPTPPAQPEEKRAPAVENIQIKRPTPSSTLATSAQPTISELDFIRRQFLECWSVPGGVRDIQSMRVTIRIQVGSDGAQIGPPEIVKRVGAGFGNEQFYRTFEESALRAVRICNPLKLPPGDPGRWHDLEFTFDPKDMLG